MRNLGLIITFCLASIALPSSGFALGLGDIEVNSFLNQPLKAEIEVISTRTGEIDDLLVTLASRDAFTRAGLSRPSHLSELRFFVQKNEEGDKAVILVSTRSAIKEPFLNFLVEADWAKGRLLKEFTVLLDPPFYSQNAPPVAPSPLVQTEPLTETPIALEDTDPSNLAIVDLQTAAELLATPEPVAIVEPVVAPEPIAGSDPIATVEPSAIIEPIALTDSELIEDLSTKASEDIYVAKDPGVAKDTEITFDGEVQIIKGDTLWSLADRFKDSEHSMGQVMLALQRSNPGAFGDNNINHLKIGAVLRAPDAGELDLLGRQEAHAQVLEQNGLWDDYVARVTGTTSAAMADDGGSADVSDSGAVETGDLSLLAPGDGDSDAAGSQSNGEDANELMKQLSFAEEELEASRVENLELESKIADLEARLNKFEELQKMVEIEDDSLAQLQASQAEEQTTIEEAVIQETDASGDDLLQDLLAEEAAAEKEVDEVIAESDLITDDAIGEEDSGASAPPVVATETGQKTGTFLDDLLPAEILDMIPMDLFTDLVEILPSMDSIMQDPIMLGALVGIVVLLLLLTLYRRWKRSSEDDDDDDGEGISVSDPEGFDFEDEFTPIGLVESGSEDNDTNINVPNEEDLFDSTQSGLPEEEDDFMSTAVISKVDVEDDSAEEAATSVQDDVLDEVDVYLAYGLYDNAEELLNQKLESDPDRAEFRSKLLDTYYATKNTEEFIKQAETLKSMGDVADSYWDRVQVMGYEMAPDNALFSAGKDSTMTPADLGIAKPESADFDLGAEEDDTNFSITDFNLGEEESGDFSETQTVAPASTTHDGAATAVMDELPLLDDVEDAAAEPADKPEEDSMADLDFAFDSGDDDGDDAMDFELPDELDLGESESSTKVDEPIERTDVFKVPEDLTDLTDLGDLDDLDDLGDVGDLDESELTGETESTAVLGTVDFPEGAADEDAEANIEATAIVGTVDFPVPMEDDIDLGLDDTSEQPHLGGDDEDELSMDLGDDEIDTGDEMSMDFDDSLVMDVDLDMDDENRKTNTFAPGDFDDPDELTAEESDIGGVDLDDIEGLMLPDDVDEVSTKLDLARAFIDMGDAEGARSSLNEVIAEGNDDQKAEAQSLLGQI